MSWIARGSAQEQLPCPHPPCAPAFFACFFGAGAGAAAVVDDADGAGAAAAAVSVLGLAPQEADAPGCLAPQEDDAPGLLAPHELCGCEAGCAPFFLFAPQLPAPQLAVAPPL